MRKRAASRTNVRYRSRSSLVVLLIAWMVAACGSQSPLRPAETPPLPADRLLRGWRHISENPGSDHSSPLTLDQTIDEALRASPELEQIRQRIDAAGEQVRQAEASFYPRLILGETFNTTDNPVYALMNIINQRRLQPDVNFNKPGRQQNFSTQAAVQWSLFEGGGRFANRSAALYDRESVASDLLAARNHLVGTVTATYYHWLQALDFIGVAERSLKSAETDEQLGEERYRAEMALPSEVARLKARTVAVRGNLVTARTGARRLQAALERFLARPIEPDEVPQPPFEVESGPMEPPAETSDGLVRQALIRRPELAAVRALIEAARDRVRSAQGELWPRLTSGAWYQWDSENFSGSAESWMINLQATWSLFEGGMTLSKIRQARVQLKEIEARGRQVALDIALEVHQAALAVEEATEKVKVAAEQKKWAEKALEEVRHQYRNQVVTVDALLQAAVAWSQAEASYTAAVFDVRIARALLRKALGDFYDWMGTGNG
jgi:outer membrane protein